MTRDLVSNIVNTSGLVPLTRLTGGSPYNGTKVDTQGAESCAIYIDVGAPGVTLGSGVTIEFLLQESNDNGSTWTAAADASLTAAVGVANGASTTGSIALLTTGYVAAGSFGVGYLGTARWLRVVEVNAGTQATGTISSARFVLGNMAYRPVTGNAS